MRENVETNDDASADFVKGLILTFSFGCFFYWITITMLTLYDYGSYVWWAYVWWLPFIVYMIYSMVRFIRQITNEGENDEPK